MPIYEYECQKCSEITEALQKFSDPPLKKCPHCGGKLHKIMSLNAFHLKGSGWYVTDYKGKNSSTRAEGKGEKSGKSESKDKSKDSSD
jgi:putative FmdB family regulatory protein